MPTAAAAAVAAAVPCGTDGAEGGGVDIAGSKLGRPPSPAVGVADRDVGADCDCAVVASIGGALLRSFRRSAFFRSPSINAAMLGDTYAPRPAVGLATAGLSALGRRFALGDAGAIRIATVDLPVLISRGDVDSPASPMVAEDGSVGDCGPIMSSLPSPAARPNVLPGIGEPLE
jgi:hypothetical protein